MTHVHPSAPAAAGPCPVAGGRVVAGGGSAVGRRSPPAAAPGAARPAPPRSCSSTCRRPTPAPAVRHRRRDRRARLPGAARTWAAPTRRLSSLVTGSHTLRVWYAGPDKARLALLGTSPRPTWSATARDVWLWPAANNTRHPRTAAGPPAEPPGRRAPAPSAADPAAGRREGAGGDRPDHQGDRRRHRVGGRAGAYELVLQPKDARSLVGEVRIASTARPRPAAGAGVRRAAPPARPSRSGFTSVDLRRSRRRGLPRSPRRRARRSPSAACGHGAASTGGHDRPTPAPGRRRRWSAPAGPAVLVDLGAAPSGAAVGSSTAGLGARRAAQARCHRSRRLGRGQLLRHRWSRCC